MLLLLHFARYGPYHHARLSSAAAALAPLGWEVVGLETAANDATYAWDEKSGDAAGPRVITAFPRRLHEEITADDCKREFPPLLDSLNPDAVAIAGWASPDALACLSWARKHDRRRIVMSETREADGKRVWWKERIKGYLISRFDGALVGGKSHRDYLVKLGMAKEKIALGYNVVDNAYFAAKTQDFKTQDAREEKRNREAGSCSTAHCSLITDHSLPYFLASNRFIERKNLLRLIEAYALYLNSTSNIQNSKLSSWDLCLLGDGELKPALIAQCQALGLNVIESAPWEESSLITNNQSLITDPNPVVWMPGFRQIDELPRFYAHAGCFIHPALEEPWGLVINEAMASGLPVLSSNNVGAAEELVDDGVNGWNFNPGCVVGMAGYLGKVAGLSSDERVAMGAASVRILDERCPTAVFGRGVAALLSAYDKGGSLSKSPKSLE